MRVLEDIKGRDVQDLLLEVRAGNIPGAIIASVMGYTGSLSTTISTVWHAGGLYSYPLNTPAAISFVSSSTADTAVSISVKGLDSDGYIQEEVISLNGTTAVSTVNTYSRLLKVHTVGSKAFVGTITGTANGQTTASMDPTSQTTKLGFITIPKGYTGYLVNAQATTGAGKSVILYLMTKPKGGVFIAKSVVELYQSDKMFPTSYEKYPELTDIEFRGIAEGTGVAVNVSMSILLLKND